MNKTCISALLVADWCTKCQEERDMEMDTVALNVECLFCRAVYPVTERYVTEKLED